MIFIKKLGAVTTLALFTLPVFVSAQTAPPAPASAGRANTQAVLIADVNVTSNALTITNNTISGSFVATSDMGNQDTVYYGFVMRSKGTGVLIGASPSLGKLSLMEKVPVSTTVSYSLASGLPEVSDVYLNLSNASGVILASVKVGELTIPNKTPTCTVSETSAVCKAQEVSELIVSVYEGGAQGTLVKTANVALTVGQSVTVKFADVLKDLDGGKYLIVGNVKADGADIDSFAKEYVNAGTKAKILSVSIFPSTMDGSNTTYKAVVYTGIYGFTASTSFALSLATPGCADTTQLPITRQANEMTFSTTCTSGNATVTLLQNGNAVDTVTQTFSLPQTASSSNMQALVGLVAFILVALALVYYIFKRQHQTMTPSQTSAPTTPQTPVRGAVTTAVLLFALFATFAPTKASAATYGISGGMFFTFCTGGGSTGCDYGDTVISTTGTVTIPNSLTSGQSYDVTIDQSNLGNLNGSGNGRYGVCYDSTDKSDGMDCDAGDVKAYVYINKGPVNPGSTPADAVTTTHLTSQTLNFTAPSSGSVQLSFWQVPAALASAPTTSVGCNDAWLSPSVKCHEGLDEETYDTPAIPIAPAQGDCEAVVEGRTTRNLYHYPIAAGASMTAPSGDETEVTYQILSCSAVTSNAQSCSVTNNGGLATCVAAGTPTVDVHFSFLQKMFSAFALSN
ncbi:MAG: LPXTG cell wall anchor domain-containing protein [Candidatus Paceibacterota bacterium]